MKTNGELSKWRYQQVKMLCRTDILDFVDKTKKD